MNKVPFALSPDTDEFVDVHDVPRGRKCNCICPSCKTPLTARQGNINAWHFAHATRGTSKKTNNDCEFSFYVSVTQMAKQILSESDSIEICLPEYVYKIIDRHPLHRCLISKEVPITQARTVQLEKTTVESKLNKHPGDIIGTVQGFPLIIGLQHQEKTFVADIELLEETRAGIICIDLSATWKLFFDREGRGNFTFKQLLKDYLTSETEHKKWLFHPRELERIPNARQELLKEPLYISAGTAISSKKLGMQGDYIDRALSNFKLS